jgi:hypothetical protein
VVSPQVPDCSPDPIFSIPKKFVYVLDMFISSYATSSQFGLCDGLIIDQLVPTFGLICTQTTLVPTSPVAEIPVTETIVCGTAVTEPTAPVPAMPVTETDESPSMVTLPTPPVPAIPVTAVTADPVAVTLPTPPVPATPVRLTTTSPSKLTLPIEAVAPAIAWSTFQEPPFQL